MYRIDICCQHSGMTFLDESVLLAGKVIQTQEQNIISYCLGIFSYNSHSPLISDCIHIMQFASLLRSCAVSV
jgi:hypothetical protein